MAVATEVVVVGGGATGTAVARDLALRGVDVTLLERGPLTAGTTGRMHGLLHSGARYAVSDPESARDCLAENLLLRDIAPHCLGATGGLFAELPVDDPDYFERKRQACEDCGIPAVPFAGEAARELEPGLAEDVERALRVPDATVDPFRLTASTAAGAEAAGAEVRTGWVVSDLRREGDRVVGVAAEPTDGGSGETIATAHVVNAAGAWAGEVAGLAEVTVELRLSRGAMAVVEPRLVDTVVNRCRPRAEGDIVVPQGEAAVLGTTDELIDAPEDIEPDPDAADFLVGELSALVPAVAEGTVTRTFWGVRPLVGSRDVPDGEAVDEPTAASRDFRVLDHEDRDGVAGLTSLVGGKLTTHRLMAERAADVVCDRLGVDRPCLTAETPLPGADDETTMAGFLDRYGISAAVETAPW